MSDATMVTSEVTVCCASTSVATSLVIAGIWVLRIMWVRQMGALMGISGTPALHWIYILIFVVVRVVLEQTALYDCTKKSGPALSSDENQNRPAPLDSFVNTPLT